jgi:hypothetical protein
MQRNDVAALPGLGHSDMSIAREGLSRLASLDLEADRGKQSLQFAYSALAGKRSSTLAHLARTILAHHSLRFRSIGVAHDSPEEWPQSSSDRPLQGKRSTLAVGPTGLPRRFRSRRISAKTFLRRSRAARFDINSDARPYSHMRNEKGPGPERDRREPPIARLGLCSRSPAVESLAAEVGVSFLQGQQVSPDFDRGSFVSSSQLEQKGNSRSKTKLGCSHSRIRCAEARPRWESP